MQSAVQVRLPVEAAKDARELQLAVGLGPPEGDRRPQIQASIVRVMKARRTMQHGALVAAVQEMLAARFVATLSDIKEISAPIP